ncbi:hypothetical protein ACVWZM_009002 [Bradyrhizobium sp. USDA 4501]
MLSIEIVYGLSVSHGERLRVESLKLTAQLHLGVIRGPPDCPCNSAYEIVAQLQARSRFVHAPQRALAKSYVASFCGSRFW